MIGHARLYLGTLTIFFLLGFLPINSVQGKEAVVGQAQTAELRRDHEEYPEQIVPFDVPFGFKSENLPSCTAKVRRNYELWEDGKRMEEYYSVTICKLPDMKTGKRAVLGEALGSARLGHGSMWINLVDENMWLTVHYHEPRTPEERAMLEQKNAMVFEQKVEVGEDVLPLVITLLPRNLRSSTVSFFLAYYHGSYEIFSFDKTKETAELIARTLNAAMNEHRRRRH